MIEEYIGLLPHIVLLNGPKGSGKTTLAKSLQDLGSGIAIVDMPDPLREALYDMCYTLDQRLHYTDVDWDSQEFKNALVPGVATTITNREALIALGHFARATFGSDFLSRRAVAAIRENADIFETFIIPNIRTEDDLSCFRTTLKPEVLLLVRIHRDGCTWEGTLGSYVSPPDIPAMDVNNPEGVPALLVSKFLHLLQEKEFPLAVSKEASSS